MPDTKQLLERAAGWYVPPSDGRERAIARTLRRHRNRRVAAAVVAFAVFAGAGTLLISAFRGESGTTPTPAPATSIVEQLGVTGTLRLPNAPFDVAIDDGEVWIAIDGRVLLVDPTRMAITASIPVPGLDTGRIAASGNAWVTVGPRHEVARIDPSSKMIVATITVPGFPLQIAADSSGVWVVSLTDGPALLMRIDPATNSVALRRPLTSPLALTVGGGSAWISDGDLLRSVRPDGSSETFPGQGADDLAYGEGSVWEARSGEVARFDPATGHVEAQIPVPSAIGIAYADGSVWVLTDTGSLSDTLYIPDPKDPSTVLRIDPTTNAVASNRVPVGAKPAYIAAGDGAAWVANYNDYLLHRIEAVPATTSRTPASRLRQEQLSVEIQLQETLLAVFHLQYSQQTALLGRVRRIVVRLEKGGGAEIGASHNPERATTLKDAKRQVAAIESRLRLLRETIASATLRLQELRTQLSDLMKEIGASPSG